MRLEIFGVALEVEGDFTPYKAGGPFEPPTGAEFDVSSVSLQGVDVTELLSNLYTSRGVEALVEIGNECAAQLDRHDAATANAARRRERNYIAPLAGCGC